MDNRQATGYMLLACKRAGFDKETTKKLFREMYYLFDIKTEGEAEKQGFEWYHNLEDNIYTEKKERLYNDKKGG